MNGGRERQAYARCKIRVNHCGFFPLSRMNAEFKENNEQIFLDDRLWRFLGQKKLIICTQKFLHLTELQLQFN